MTNPICQRSLRHCLHGCLMVWLLVTPCLAEEPDWRDYAALLAAHVKAGERFGMTLNLVDYRALAADAHYAAALAALENFPLAKLAGTREQLAFYINAYNLLAIRMVVDDQPLASIKDVGNLLWPVWKREAGRLGSAAVTLDDVEHHLRSLHEPRIHFAIVCASLSCPDLRNEPFLAATLEAQLDDQASRFLANPGKGLRLTGDTAHVSKIFDWFGEDFAAQGGVANFIARFHALPAGIKLEADVDYDWRLNRR
jgi:hypothetical protein